MNFPQQAQEIIEAFAEMPHSLKLQLLLEYANELPDLPESFGDPAELFERVEECQSPVFLFVEVLNQNVAVYLTAPKEAPTTRGFASILQSALTSLKSDEVLEFSDSFIDALGLTSLVSPLRIQGMYGMLFRIKRQVREKSALQ